MNDIPLVLTELNGKLIAGIGPNLILYDLGKTQLLKQCESKKIVSTITNIVVNGQRIYVSTVNDSVSMMRYDEKEDQFYLIADDFEARYSSSILSLDYNTIACADKFENFYILRLQQNCDEENDEDPIGTKYKFEMGYLNGAAIKFENNVNYHLGELITCMKKGTLSKKGSQNKMSMPIIYGTSTGSIGVFSPIQTKEHADFMIHFEMYLRLEFESLTGRDHKAYRSIYSPIKSVIDGDFLSEYLHLPISKQKSIATEIEQTQADIIRKIESYSTNHLN